MEEIFAVLDGVDIETYRKKQQQRAKLTEIAKLYINKPKKHWPHIEFNWDFSVESMRFALDGVKQDEFEKCYPQGFSLGWVKRKEFDKKLCHFSRRNGAKELWRVGFKSKLAFNIAYISEGLPITPPLVKPTNNKELLFCGGHHRYAIANAIRVELLPIYMELCNIEEISEIVAIQWDKEN